MIIVTGTKRSGTSMWMQVLKAAGLPVLGEAFSKDWGETIRDANPEGFYESPLRQGIYFRTNPHPRTGVYLFPRATRHHAVKVFVPGLVRSDVAFIDRVLGTMREWRAYHRSLQRLYAMEHRNRSALRGEELPPPCHVPPAIEWWSENYALLSDVLTRGHALHLVAYESTLAEPERTVPEAVAWLGVPELDAAAAVAAVRPDLRTQDDTAREAPPAAGDDPESAVPPEAAEVFDALYARVRDRQGLDGPFIDRLNATHELLQPRIEEAVGAVREERLRRHRARREAANEAALGEAAAGPEAALDDAVEASVPPLEDVESST
ncbi:MAG: hypothetical protein AAF447_04290 [Myxococcota bacterium]